MTKTKIIAKETVVKLMNSKNRYLKISENEFTEIAHGDTAEVLKDEDHEHLDVIYRFKKENLKY